jgi:hypothetical protein
MNIEHLDAIHCLLVRARRLSADLRRRNLTLAEQDDDPDFRELMNLWDSIDVLLPVWSEFEPTEFQGTTKRDLAEEITALEKA